MSFLKATRYVRLLQAARESSDFGTAFSFFAARHLHSSPQIVMEFEMSH
jgi:hypothetical protein